jgi:hypothetical protein
VLLDPRTLPPEADDAVGRLLEAVGDE